MEEGQESQDLRLAERLAELRIGQGWSLEQLAQLTGISRATLSRVERAETSPTASLLGKLSAAYGLTTSRLLMALEDNPPELIRRAQQPVWHDRETGFERRSVSAPAPGFRAELISGLLKSGATISYDSPPVDGLEQHIWMLEGVLEFTLDGRCYRLEAGDCLRFHLHGTTSFHVPGPQDARYAIVISRP
ncbi:MULTISPECIES: helix-turn-helix domain-containing protein [Rahnella]|jgi:transcriptional regulator with XRE-family HTH domain|uniref:helix-turn-helix domain-containing protein n=1 Tax=Rahnella TaxID=34037 RepID=UPI000DD2F2FC|nr:MULTISPECIES: XRE family transcriptional regulator [Rahnella]MDH2896713.1 XRE family transcriptional regulator [Rahnella variigena]RBQ33560.1 transcriptional regulator [Rahnella aquatilis]RYJ17428.1 transcriptional regulator [Rahnella variigena]TCQ93036.1 XRE family transcriptional regulator [Rahnella sp. JUb53]